MALRVEGLIDVRRGDGIYLLRAADDVVRRSLPSSASRIRSSPRSGEVRNALKALAGRCAAARRTDDDLAEIVSALRLMEEEITTGRSGAQR